MSFWENVLVAFLDLMCQVDKDFNRIYTLNKVSINYFCLLCVCEYVCNLCILLLGQVVLMHQ